MKLNIFLVFMAITLVVAMAYTYDKILQLSYKLQ